VTRIGAASTAQDRVALVAQALSSSASGLQKAYNVAPLFANHIDGTGLTIATLVSYGDKSAQAYINQYDATMGCRRRRSRPSSRPARSRRAPIRG